MAPATLPVDVLDIVCGFLDTQSLRALATTNSTLSSLAHRHLYRNISLLSSPKAVRCLKTLAERPHLASYVREFSIRLNPNRAVLRPFVALFTIALNNIAKVTSLDVLLPRDASTCLSAVSATYARLTFFASNFPLDGSVLAFLQRTPMLQELQLGDGSTAASIPTTILPRLSALTGSCEAAAAFVPGRPLESLHLHSGNLTDAVLSALSQSTAPVTMFGAFTKTLTPSLLLSLALNLPDMHHLCIMTVLQSFPHQHDEPFYAEVAQALGSFPQLKTAQLAGIHWPSWQKHKSGNRSAWGDRPANARESTLDSFDPSEDLSYYY